MTVGAIGDEVFGGGLLAKLINNREWVSPTRTSVCANHISRAARPTTGAIGQVREQMLETNGFGLGIATLRFNKWLVVVLGGRLFIPVRGAD